MDKPFKIWKDVYAVGGPDLSHPSDCCVYLIDGEDLILIDSGAGKSFSALVDNIALLGFDPKKLKAIIVTHAHIDHIGALYQFQQQFGLQVIAHKLDSAAIESGEKVGAEFYGVSYHPCQVNQKIDVPETSITIGRQELKVVHIPGHTSGSIAVYLDIGKRVLFGQDIHGPYVPSWGADLDKARSSLQKLIELKADILCEGHFGVFRPKTKVKRYIEGYFMEISSY